MKRLAKTLKPRYEGVSLIILPSKEVVKSYNCECLCVCENNEGGGAAGDSATDAVNETRNS